MGFELTYTERRYVFARDPRPLVRDEDPELEKGQVVVLLTFPGRFIAAGAKQVEIPEEPAVWITISSVVRTTKGHWSIRYDITDRRDLDRADEFLAPKLGYTADPHRSIDPSAPVPEREHRRQSFNKRQSAVVNRAARRQAEELLPVEQRIKTLQAEAKRRRVDIRSELRLVEKLQREGRPTDSPLRSICVKLDRDLAA